MQPNQNNKQKSPILKILFFTLMIALTMIYTVFTFKGLTSKYGMDQAQIGRQIAKKEGLTTNFIRPVAIQQLTESGKPINFNKFHDTTHSPLNSLIYAGVIKAFGGDDPEKFAMSKNDNVFQLDRIIAGTCILFFLVAIGINYMLISNIFDTKIASIVAILMLVSDHFWSFSQSGLPQMLMLCIFSTACYLIWKAIQRQEAGLTPIAPVILSGFMFGLLALAHWMTLWIFFGYIIFSISYFKPRGIAAIFTALVVLAFIAGPLLYNAKHSDGMMGTAYYYINGATGSAQELQLRHLSLPKMHVKELVMRVIQTTLLQTNQIHIHIGGFFLATGFFLSLIHQFRKSSISIFRWSILTMWGFAALGMSIYGLSNDPLDPNQLHILFMPLMAAFAIALISILWAKTALGQPQSAVRMIPFIIIIIITASPMFISLKYEFRKKGSEINTPYIYNQIYAKYIKENEAVFTDQPWAVAWYADRKAIWIPESLKSINTIEEISQKQNSKIAGILLTPYSRSQNHKSEELIALSYNYLGISLSGTGYAELHPSTAPIISPKKGRYPIRIPLSENPKQTAQRFTYTLYTNVDIKKRLEEQRKLEAEKQD